MRCRPAGGDAGAAAPERMSSRSIRVGEAWMTSNSSPRTSEPLARRWECGRPTRRAGPPTVVDRPAGSATPNRSSIACGGHVAVGLEDGRARRRARRRTSSSCSSKISPTSSSSRSSSVAMPSVPPNSSSTTARWRRSRCMSSSRSPQVRLAGVTATGRTGSGSPGRSLNRSNACSIPTISSSVPRIDRDPAVAALGEDQPDVLQRRVLVHRHDVGARASSPRAPAGR